MNRPLIDRMPAGPVTEALDGADVPILYEDDGQEEMGDSDVHTRTGDILFYGLQAHLVARAEYRVFWNLELNYHKNASRAYISPDIMIVTPRRPLPDNLGSYRIGPDGPAPVLVMEVLSERTFQQGDLKDKPLIYAKLRIPEYVLVDVTGRYLSSRLRLKRLRRSGSWADEQDRDGGVTSRLGFRLVIEPDGQVRVIDMTTGKPYARPAEAQALLDRVQALEAELARLRRVAPAEQPKPRKGKGRRPKP